MIAQGVDLEAIERAEIENRKRHFWTTFKHLDAHHGFRKGVISGYLGTSGCGKSSLMKTLALQAAATGPDVNPLYWLSEESVVKYAKAMKKYSDLTGNYLKNIKFFEESSMDMEKTRTHQERLEFFREVVMSGFHQIVFIDNMTTSFLYKGPLWEQGRTVEFLKNMAKDLDIAIVYMAHTASNVSDNQGKLIAIEDIRGSKDLVIQTSYLYVLQKFSSNGRISLTLRTVKHRDHDYAAGTYLLTYDNNLAVYTGDAQIDFEEVNKIFKSRDHLGKR